MKFKIVGLLLCLASLACGEQQWRVTDDTFPKFRKMNLEGFGKIPTEEELKQVDAILKGVTFVFFEKIGAPALKQFRTDIKEEREQVFMIKSEPGGMLSGTKEGFTGEPHIFLLPVDKDRFMVWFRRPAESFQIEKK